MSNFLSWIVKRIFGVEFKKENFVRKGLWYSAAIISFTYLIIVHGGFFNMIDTVIELSNQPWYSGIITKFSFLMVSVNMVIRSLFTKLNNPWGRFKAAFVTQLVGFIGTLIVTPIFNNFIKGSNIPTGTQFILGLMPFTISIAVMLTIRYIYNIGYFDEKKFFGKKP